MCRNTEMYGHADLEAYEASMLASNEYRMCGLAAAVSNEIARAQDEFGVDPVAAQQGLNRARFLIARCCPLTKPDADAP